MAGRLGVPSKGRTLFRKEVPVLLDPCQSLLELTVLEQLNQILVLAGQAIPGGLNAQDLLQIKFVGNREKSTQCPVGEILAFLDLSILDGCSKSECPQLQALLLVPLLRSFGLVNLSNVAQPGNLLAGGDVPLGKSRGEPCTGEGEVGEFKGRIGGEQLEEG